MTWILLSILLQSVATACAKQAALTSLGGDWSAFVANPWFAGMLAALIAQTGTWIMALRRLPLSFAYPFMSLTFGLNLLSAWLIFNETIHYAHIAGILLIMTGVGRIARSRPS
ncbi:MAG: hypothetical protein C4523_07485 [Myxococcales bacterium]|nr:MAG: hypothetical protein C4523_07485 [Myxococcales bacterium]